MDNVTYLPLARPGCTAMSGATSAQKPTPGSPEAKLKKACTDFESIFISMIMRQMMDSIPKSSESTTGAGLMNALADQAVAEHIARSGGIGLADVMYKQISRPLLDPGTKVYIQGDAEN